MRDKKPEKLLTLPTILTLLRLILVPVFIYLWLDQGKYSPLLSAITFSLASITDWLDGYLARKVNADVPLFSYTLRSSTSSQRALCPACPPRSLASRRRLVPS